LLLALLGAVAWLPACVEPVTWTDAPACRPESTLALVAQSVPGATYVPCLDHLPIGWTVSGVRVRNGPTRFVLHSDRAPGRPVDVRLVEECTATAAIPLAPRAPGARSALQLSQISPRYAGVLYDAFPGGCVTYRFDFPRGPHIALMDELQRSVHLYARRQLEVELRTHRGIDLGA
jgi:hypothetical protein